MYYLQGIRQVENGRTAFVRLVSQRTLKRAAILGKLRLQRQKELEKATGAAQEQRKYRDFLSISPIRITSFYRQFGIFFRNILINSLGLSDRYVRKNSDSLWRSACRNDCAPYQCIKWYSHAFITTNTCNLRPAAQESLALAPHIQPENVAPTAHIESSFFFLIKRDAACPPSSSLRKVRRYCHGAGSGSSSPARRENAGAFRAAGDGREAPPRHPPQNLARLRRGSRIRLALDTGERRRTRNRHRKESA